MRFFSAFLCLSLAYPAAAWDATGHRAIAAIAYDRLTPKARARVDDLIRQHPDYHTILIRNAPSDPAARARAAFITAAVWPDTIKGDPRFWDDTRADAKPTPTLPGFPDMKRHTNWHYYDTPYAPDGAHAEKQAPPSALTELPHLIHGLTEERFAVYDLPWFEHVEGDVHQPLHDIGRTLISTGKSDAGGNAVFVEPGRNLHSLWDSACGTDQSDAYVTKYAAEAVAAHPAPDHVEKNPKKWISDGAKIAIAEVYTFGLENGTREHPIHLSESYVENARKVAQAQIALAGYRLAAVLNGKFK